MEQRGGWLSLSAVCDMGEDSNLDSVLAAVWEVVLIGQRVGGEGAAISTSRHLWLWVGLTTLAWCCLAFSVFTPVAPL